MNDCLFCKVVRGEIPARIVARTDHTVAFRDIDPKAPTHVLVIPIEHVSAVRAAEGEAGRELLGRVFQAAAAVATAEGLDAAGYRLVTNTGDAAGQTVDHLHVHVIGGRKLSWPPG